MVCIHCGHKTKVTNSRTSSKRHTTWRRRECLNCRSVLTSREYPDLQQSLRVKTATNDLEPFYRDKLLLSITNSLSHRKTALRDATELTDTIIGRLLALHSGGLLSIDVISETAAGILQRFDTAAEVHYRAHHQ